MISIHIKQTSAVNPKRKKKRIVSRLSQNKAIGEDFYENSILWKQIPNKNDDKIAKNLHLWDSK